VFSIAQGVKRRKKGEKRQIWIRLDDAYDERELDIASQTKGRKGMKVGKWVHGEIWRRLWVSANVIEKKGED